MAATEDELREKASRVKLLILDVDGVLTDGGIIYTASGDELKRFDVKDGHGIKLLQRCGVRVAIVTARESEVVCKRAADLGIEFVYQGAKEKLKAFNDILERTGVLPEETAYIGDDLIDIPVLKRVGLSVAVADAVGETLLIADYVTKKPGGRGAVREATELILKLSGRWEEVTSRYFV